MSSNVQNQWFLLGAAVVGVLGAAVVAVVEHYNQQKKQHAMARDLDRLNKEVTDLKAELNELMVSQKKSPKKHRSSRRSKNTSSASTASEDYMSATDFESSDLEFYDLSDDDDTLRLDSEIESFDTQLLELDGQLESNDETVLLKVIDKINEIALEYPNQAELYWRLGKAYHRLGRKAADIKEKEYNINLGLDACTKSLDLNQNSSEAHKWYAILIGSRSEYQPIKNKIEDGHVFKKHLDVALSLKPEDAILHHLLGRFSFEVASLKWYERKAASALFSEPPSATYDEALEYLLKSEKLSTKEWKENKLILAKVYINMGDYKQAVYWLEKADALETSEDEGVHLEVKGLLNKYSSYR